MMDPRWTRRTVAALLVTSFTAAPVLPAEYVEPIRAEEEIPDHLLLDVGIRLFDPGLPEEDESAEEDKGIFPDLRRSEARFMPFHLKSVLESTGQWGAVRVVPEAAGTSDVTVREIAMSSPST